MNKDLLIRFLLGGAAVMVSYLVTVISPWKILAGIFAAFPAVMITAILMVGITAGSKNAAKIANGTVFGMIGGVVCAATVWAVLQFSGNWILSILLGLILWLGSSVLVSILKEKIGTLKLRRERVMVNILTEPRLKNNK